jgi:hypothetical protein
MEYRTDDTFKDMISEKLNNDDYTGAHMHLLQTTKTFSDHEVDWYRVLQLLPSNCPGLLELLKHNTEICYQYWNLSRMIYHVLD